MEQGIIKRILTVRNYGFISIDDGELFFHKSAVVGNDFEELQEGQAVECESEDGPNGPIATVVRATDGESQTVENESEDSPEGPQDVAERAIDRIEGRTAEHESEDDTSTNTTVKYVVAVFTMRPRWLRKHPDAAKFRIRVLSKKKFDQIAEGGDIKVLLKKRYRRWVKEEDIEEHKTKLAAWKAAIKKKKTLSEKKGKPVDLHLGKPSRRVYVFEMAPTVIDNSKFAKMNPLAPKDGTATCVYVGETCRSPTKRYKQHRSADHRAKTKWGNKFFLPTFDEAFREDLLVEFQETGQSISGLNTYEALKQELALRKWLQDEKGIAAYSN